MSEPEKPVEETKEDAPEMPAHMELVADIANRLVSHDKDYSRLVASMLASRQLYAMCLYELEMLCDQTDFKKATKVKDEDNLDVGKSLPKDQLVLLKEVLINSAAIQAQNPFDEKDLFTGMVNIVFPWMQDVVNKHNILQAEKQKEVYEAAEKERTATTVAIGLDLVENSVLSRKKPVMFVGERYLLNWLADYVAEESRKPDTNVNQVVRLRSVEQSKVVSKDPSVFQLGVEAWKDSASSNEAFQKVYEEIIGGSLIAPVDVLLVEDLGAGRDSASYVPLLSTANEAQKKYKRWAEKAGCLLVGLLPISSPLKAGELNTQEYETLRMHNILKGVADKAVHENGVDYKVIYVGQQEVARVTVEELDAYRESKIIIE